jgi:hypothetical protein
MLSWIPSEIDIIFLVENAKNIYIEICYFTLLILPFIRKTI